MEYDRISDGQGSPYGVPIEPPVCMWPFEDDEDISDPKEDEGVEPMHANPVAAFDPPATDPVDPPLAAAVDALYAILQTLQAIQARQDRFEEY